MRTGFFPVMCIMLCIASSAKANQSDTTRLVELDDVTVSASGARLAVRSTSVSVETADRAFLWEHFSGNLMQTLKHKPGIHSMDIGAGFSKPVIRGMGFNRISVVENGIKQEGQQWGSDHGLEIDAFNIEQITILKGPASLLYGSDAMGGTIEIKPLPAPLTNQWFGEAVVLGRSVNDNLGASVMVGRKKDNLYIKARYSEQHFGDLRIPADTIIYLTQYMPIHGRRLKNTAGIERNANLYGEYRNGRYYSNYAVSNAYQRMGFFPGAHGIPDANRITDDGNHRNIDLPYSTVNHLKASTRQQVTNENGLTASLTMGYQHNFREEYSAFHTHYGNQPAPEIDPDKELSFSLNTWSTTFRLRWDRYFMWEHQLSYDVQYQQNSIAGYSFLLPEYKRFANGAGWLTTYRPGSQLTASFGLRYDYGAINSAGYKDAYLENYLTEMNYPKELISQYRWRSYAVKRNFGDFSGQIGIVWQIAPQHLFKSNIGRGFRLPGANELASNGVHHGTFRHEQGSSNLNSEQGWQFDLSYDYQGNRFNISVSPFASIFNNYVYLKPTGEWSVLPHAGQIYRYTGAKVLFAGAEAMVDIKIANCLKYSFAGEYLYTYNRDEHIPLAFSPPPSMRNTLTWQKAQWQIYIEMHSITAQNRVARNEERTPGANLLHAGMLYTVKCGEQYIDMSLTVENLLNTRYYNHLSFYRKVEIPEPGRNIQLLIKIPLKKETK